MTDGAAPQKSASQQSTPQKGALHLTEMSFQKAILEAGKPVLVDFYADWCGPCLMAAPIIDKLSVEMADKMLITKLDVDEARAIAQEYGVMSIPTVIVFKAQDGKVVEVKRKIGFPGEAGYRQLVAEVVEVKN